jgi:uncharacterized protein YjiS (DUF1127 family)
MPAAIRHLPTNSHSGQLSPLAWGRSIMQALGDRLRLWRSRSRERQSFAVLGERELHDLGLSRWDVEHEIAKPFWRG